MERAPAGDESERRRFVDGPRLIVGIVVAAVAAGPAFFVSGMLASELIAAPDEAAFSRAGALPLTLLYAIRYAFLPALLPVTFAAAAMAVLGAMFLGARSYLAWLSAGAIEAALISVLFPDLLGFPVVIAALVMTGMVCAVICRAFVRWPAEAGRGRGKPDTA